MKNVNYGEDLMRGAVAHAFHNMYAKPGQKIYLAHPRKTWKSLIGRRWKSATSPLWINDPVIVNAIKICNNFAPHLAVDRRMMNYAHTVVGDKSMCRRISQTKHAITVMAENFGIYAPELRCFLFLTDDEKAKIGKVMNDIPNEFIAIEPISQSEWTLNRSYPFEKWQAIVNQLYSHIPVVQVGVGGSKKLKNAIDLTGKFSFRETAGIIGEAKLFLAAEGGLVHAATAFNTTAIVIITGFQSVASIGYPQNINVDIANHGPCDLVQPCENCKADAEQHDYQEIITAAENFLLL